jgi:ABC-2 type transport system ATP-binding protein
MGLVEIRTLLQRLAHEEGITVFMSSHILGEVARLAQRIGIIHRGRLLQELSVDELRRNRRKRLLVQARNLEAAQSVLVGAGHQPIVNAGAALNGGAMLELTGKDAINSPDAVATILVGAGTPPTHLRVEEEDLERYFMRLIDEGDHA